MIQICKILFIVLQCFFVCVRDCGFPGIIEKMTFICSFEKDNPSKCKDESLEKVLLQIYNNSTLLSSVADLKNSFHTNKECLIHGNLQTDSILCSLNGDIKVSGQKTVFAI